MKEFTEDEKIIARNILSIRIIQMKQKSSGGR